MTTLRDIRRRLRSVENIKKITDAMERVAAAQLRRAQVKAEQSIPYVRKMQLILEKLALTEYSHPLFEQREVKKTALVIIGADRGLSGSYNSNIFQAADRFLKNYTSENLELFLFGKKPIEYYRRKKWPISFENIGWGGKISLHDVMLFTSRLLEGFMNGIYDEVWIVYTHYVNIMEKSVQVEKLLNIGKKKVKNPIYLNYIFEPDPVSIYNEILPRYLISRLQTAFHESFASELASRIVAMQVASKNSANMIEDLTLIRNKVRQEGITREIIEITNASR